MRPYVELEDVAFDYGEVPVLERINLTVQPGDFLGIIGPNGSGKTTLLRIMLGLLEPTRGAVRLFGHPPAAFRQWGRLGYVPQRAMLDPGLPATVQEVVGTGLVPTLGLFGGVGPEAQTSFYALLHHLNRERDVTLILVSHDIGVVAKEVTKLACLNRRLIFHGRPGDFLSDAALTALYGPAVRVVSHDH